MATKITEHFTLEEATYSYTAESMGIVNSPNDVELDNIKRTLHGMEQCRAAYSASVGAPCPVRISSLFRNAALNTAIGGSATSDHRKGLACDHVTVSGVLTPRQMCEIIVKAGIKFDQLILENVGRRNPDGQWVHIGFGLRMRQQVLTATPTGANGKMEYVNGLVRLK